MRLPHSLVFACVLSALSMLALGCNYAQLKAAPDASPPCKGSLVLESPCVPLAAGMPGCGSDLQATSTFGRDYALDGGTYPSPCSVVIYSGETDQDEQCTQLGTCQCGNDGGVFAWTCFQ